MTNNRINELKELAIDLTTETLHGPIPTKTTMKLAIGILELIQDIELQKMPDNDLGIFEPGFNQNVQNS